MPDNSVELIRDEAKRIHESAVYSAQGQYEAAKRWRVVHWILSVLTAGLATAGAILTFADCSPVVAGTLTIVAALVAATAAGVRPDRLAERAQASGNDYTSLRNDVRRFVNIDLESGSTDEARARLDDLAGCASELDHAADPIPKRAYGRAKSNIENGGQDFEVDQS